jgi:hypothetical protein
MCGRFTQHYTWQQIHEFLSVFGPAQNLQARYNIAPTTLVDMVRHDAEGRRELVRGVRWGLIPNWWKKQPHLFTAADGSPCIAFAGAVGSMARSGDGWGHLVLHDPGRGCERLDDRISWPTSASDARPFRRLAAWHDASGRPQARGRASFARLARFQALEQVREGDDDPLIVLTELGQQFVHYTMDDMVPRTGWSQVGDDDPAILEPVGGGALAA